MDLDIERYNYDLLAGSEYCISVLAGICTAVIDSPVTRSSILYENSDLIQLPTDEHTTFPKRIDISTYLENTPSNGIPNKLRGIPLLFGVTVISHISSYLLDRVIPSKVETNSEERQNPGGILPKRYRYCYSTSMHYYRKCKLQNMAVVILTNVVADLPPGAQVEQPIDNKCHVHDWNHRGLFRKIVISSLSSLLTYPVWSIYVRIAFDLGIPKEIDTNQSMECAVDYKYDINASCTNVVEIGNQIVSENNKQIRSLYNGFGLHLLSNFAYQTIVHYSREFLIELSPRIHSYKVIDKFISKRVDPFEYSMFCIWWSPPIIARMLCYPLLRMQNRAILGGDRTLNVVSDAVADSVISWSASIGSMMKRMFHGVVGNTTRFMTEVQMMELFGLWSLIRISHKRQYSQLKYEQDTDECMICYRKNADHIFVPCGHKFCKADAMRVIANNMNCPTCRMPIEKSFSDLGAWKKIFWI